MLNNSRHWLKPFSLAAILLLLSSCGYQLCNPCIAWPDNFRTVEIVTGDPASPVLEQLRENVRIQGLSLVTNDDSADAVFVLLSEDRQKRLLAVGTGNEPAEYELIYRVTYRIDRRNPAYSEHQSSEQNVLPYLLGSSKAIESRRAQVFNPQAVLAVEVEAESLYREMARYLANQITRSAVTELNQASGQSAAQDATK